MAVASTSNITLYPQPKVASNSEKTQTDGSHPVMLQRIQVSNGRSCVTVFRMVTEIVLLFSITGPHLVCIRDGGSSRSEFKWQSWGMLEAWTGFIITSRFRKTKCCTRNLCGAIHIEKKRALFTLPSPSNTATCEILKELIWWKLDQWKQKRKKEKKKKRDQGDSRD